MLEKQNFNKKLMCLWVSYNKKIHIYKPEVRIRIRTKMSRIPNSDWVNTLTTFKHEIAFMSKKI